MEFYIQRLVIAKGCHVFWLSALSYRTSCKKLLQSSEVTSVLTNMLVSELLL